VIVIGELINTSRQAVRGAVERRDLEFIVDLARRQKQAGADYIDLHAGSSAGEEPEALIWLTEQVQQAVATPLCLDSPNPAALRAALPHCSQLPMINSVTAETERYAAVAPLAAEFDVPLVALCMDDRGVPTTAEQRIEVAHTLCARLEADGIPRDRIFLDPIVQPVGTDPQSAVALLDAVRAVRRDIPEAHVVLGMSNVSFGLPARGILNRAFMVLAVGAGADALILDPTDMSLMSLLRGAEAVLGRDEFCMRYIQEFRAGRLKG